VDRIPTRPLGLGIDYGAPEKEFSSAGARGYASQGNFSWAHAYEEICKRLRMDPPKSDEEYSRRRREENIIMSVFGDAAMVVMEQIQIECDPTYDPGAPNSSPVYEAINRRSVRAWGQVDRPMTSSWARRARPTPVRPTPPRISPDRSIPARHGPIRTSWARGYFSPIAPWGSMMTGPQI
jgi:hypothetical protein